MSRVEEVEREMQSEIDELAAEVERQYESGNWHLGKEGHRLLEHYDRDLTIQRLADRLGMTRTKLSTCVAVWRAFSAMRQDIDLSWSHFREALLWDDREKWLKKAAGAGLSCRQMVDARNLHHEVKGMAPITQDQLEQGNPVAEPVADKKTDRPTPKRVRDTVAKSQQPDSSVEPKTYTVPRAEVKRFTDAMGTTMRFVDKLRDADVIDDADQQHVLRRLKEDRAQILKYVGVE